MIEKKIWEFKTSSKHAEQHQDKNNTLRDQLGAFINFWFFAITISMLVLGSIGFAYTKISIESYKIK